MRVKSFSWTAEKKGLRVAQDDTGIVILKAAGLKNLG